MQALFTRTAFALSALAAAAVLSTSALASQENTVGVDGEVLPTRIPVTQTRAQARAANLPGILKARANGEVLEGEAQAKLPAPSATLDRAEVRAQAVQARRTGQILEGDAAPSQPAKASR